MVESLLHFSQATGIYWFMNTPWGWPVIESLHFIGLTLLIGTVGIFDLRLLGFAPGLDYRSLHRLVPIGVAGYGLNVTTGVLFVSTAPDQYLFNPAFQTKLFIMLIAGINMLLFYAFCAPQLKTIAATESVATRAKIIGLLSICCWTAIIVCGRLITYYRPPYHWCFWC